MRKWQISSAPLSVPPSGQTWLDVDRTAVVEITSEENGYPIESALLEVRDPGWRAADSGSQTIRLIFDEPHSSDVFGARGYVLKDEAPQNLRKVVEFVVLRQTFFPRELRATSISRQTHFLAKNGTTQTPNEVDLHPPHRPCFGANAFRSTSEHTLG
jgi:hypothetical protein